MLVKYILSVTLLISVTFCDGYRILALFPFKGRSHFNFIEQVVKALAEKGHQVDVVSGFPLKEPFPNYTDLIKIPDSKHESAPYEEFNNRKLIWKVVHKLSSDMCELLGHPKLNKIIKNPPTDPPYDLVIVHFFLGYQCFTAIGHLWNVPVVGIVTTFLYPQNHRYIGNPLNLAIAPKNIRGFKENMTFFDRLYNVIYTHHYISEFYAKAPQQDAIIRKHLGPNIPSYTELEKSISLMITNSHPSIQGIQPKTPALIEIGGIHITDDNATVEPRLQKLMDESKNGFIYFSFGSLVAVETIPQEIIEKMFNAFRKIAPMRVVMKASKPENLTARVPDNVDVFTWVHQRKLLQHPNLKAFISHGGGLGTQEAIYYGVPIVCVPFFADQHVNCDIAQNKNYGIRFQLDTDQKEYDDVINEIITNPKYKIAAKKLSVLFRDRAMKPKDEAVYWIEYIIRHGKNVLRSPAMDLTWWQVELLDVYAFLICCFVIASSISILIFVKVCRLVLTLNESFLKKYLSSSKKID